MCLAIISAVILPHAVAEPDAQYIAFLSRKLVYRIAEEPRHIPVGMNRILH